MHLKQKVCPQLHNTGVADTVLTLIALSQFAAGQNLTFLLPVTNTRAIAD